MKRTLILLLAALPLWATAQDGGKENPGSLTAPDARNPFVDRKASRVGDIVTILIEESTLAKNSADTSATKSDSSDAGTAALGGLISRLFGPLTSSATSSVGGTGTTQQNSSMRARMSVIVREVTPSGQLVVEGTRSLVTNRETQTLVLSGIVRRDDIRADNTVLSTNLADAEIRMEGKGLIADRQRRGILTQIMDWLF